jgi:rhodanese-related sulfurtransferase
MEVIYYLFAVCVIVGVIYAVVFTKRSASLVNYTPEQIAARRRKDSDFVLLDVRSDNERQRNRIEGSIHIPVGDIEKRAEELAKFKANEIVCYCQGGVRSVTAATALKSLGFNASNMAGGIAAWKSKGLEVKS